MTIACNSAYVQTETLNSSSPGKPLLCILMPNINVQADYFLPVMSKFTLRASIGLH